ncbi:MAG: HlyC/CorC family transporter [Dehalococcoidia bacterium]|nr:HlyC/CorC family transporter [Dehalococcoidia bacterium]
MDDLGRIFAGVTLAGVLLLFGLSGALRAALVAWLRSSSIASPPDLSSLVERLRSLGPDPQVAIEGVRFLLCLVAVLLTAGLGVSLGLSNLAVALVFVLFLAVLLALEAGARALGRRYAWSMARVGAPLLLALTLAARPVWRRVLVDREAAFLRAPWEPLLTPEASAPTEERPAPPDPEAIEMLRAVLNLDKTQVREILVPRVDMVAVEVNDPPSRVVELALAYGYSRIPLYEETVDQVVGIVYVRDLLRSLQEGGIEKVSLRELARPVLFVPESKRVYELLREFQEGRVHIAIVVDEYGGTAGLVTIEDILEEIVGEIEDEFQREQPKVEWVGEGEAIVDARLSLDDLKAQLEVEIEGEGFDTVGGFVYAHLGRVPNPGDQFTAEGVHVEVLSTTGRRIRRVKVRLLTDLPEEEAAGPKDS